mmetsp:Transcript_11523/g.20844  ORF Transcript_11523/g.20844 Transcript_11523/m.20844 type:complete len:325 (+) Transcript_11523:31-1005(+)
MASCFIGSCVFLCREHVDRSITLVPPSTKTAFNSLISPKSRCSQEFQSKFPFRSARSIVLQSSSRTSDSTSIDSESNDTLPDPPNDPRVLQKVVVGLTWIGLVISAVSFGVSHPVDEYQEIFFKDITNPTAANPMFWAIFSGLGTWVTLFATLLYPGTKSQKLWYRLSVVLSFGFGMFALGPYLAFANSAPEPKFKSDSEDFTGKILNSKVSAGILTVFTLYLFVIASGALDFPVDALNLIIFSYWAELQRLFNSSILVHATCLDFVCCWALLPVAVVDDMKRRKLWSSDAISNWLVILFMQAAPMIGPCIYLLTRPEESPRSK